MLHILITKILIFNVVHFITTLSLKKTKNFLYIPVKKKSKIMNKRSKHWSKTQVFTEHGNLQNLYMLKGGTFIAFLNI